MNRAVVVLVLACGLLGARLAAAPPSNKVHRIGFLWNASPALTHNLLEAFREGLHVRGYVEGTHFVLEHRYAEGRPERLPVLAAELVGLHVAAIVTVVLAHWRIVAWAMPRAIVGQPILTRCGFTRASCDGRAL